MHMTEQHYDPSGFFTVKVLGSGRVTIPEAIRDAFKIGDGDTVTLRFYRIVTKAPKQDVAEAKAE